MKNLFSLIDVFRKGSAVADVVRAKNWGALGGVLSVLLFSLSQAAKAFGFDIGLTTEQADAIAFGIATAAGVFTTYATSDKVGILPPKPETPAAAGADVPSDPSGA
jgi:hypothetical protein